MYYANIYRSFWHLLQHIKVTNKVISRATPIFVKITSHPAMYKLLLTDDFFIKHTLVHKYIRFSHIDFVQHIKFHIFMTHKTYLNV